MILLRQDTVEFNELELAYIAGFIDGEGTISVFFHKKKKLWRPIFEICNTDLTTLEWIRDTLGCGSIYSCKKEHKENWKKRYTLQFFKADTLRVLPILIPFLKLKVRQANILIEYCSGEISKNAEEERLLWLQFLNQKGVNA